MQNLYWSRFIYKYSINNFFCLYHTVNFNVVFTKILVVPNGKQLSYHDIRHIGARFLETLIKLGMIITDVSDDNILIENLRNVNNSIRLSNLNLLISNSCNMNCDYCQIKRNIVKIDNNSFMTIMTTQKALKYFFENCDKKMELTVNITGGEPLLNIQALKYVLNVIDTVSGKKDLPNIRKVVFTNGTLITAEIAKILSRHNVFVITSLDGTANTHNKLRKYSDGKDTFDDALNGYQIAKTAGCTCAISAVYSIDMNMNEFADWIQTLSPVSVGLNYPHKLLNTNKFDDVNFDKYNKAILSLRKSIKQSGIYLENYERYKRSFDSKQIRIRECQACGRGMTIDSKGNVGVCKSLLVSNIFSEEFDDKFNIFNNTTFLDWSSRTPLNNDDCLNCPAIGICGGGCAYDSYILYDGNFQHNDTRMCKHIRGILYDILSQLPCAETLNNDFRVYSQLTKKEPLKFESVGH